MRLFVLQMGFVEVARSVLHGPGAGEAETLRLPVPSYLVEPGPGHWVLIDSGMHEEHVERPDRTFGDDPELAAAIRPELAPENLLPAQLALLGLEPADISVLVNTHLHFDHCGQNHLFAGLPIVVQREAHAAAVAAGRTRDLFDLPGLQYRFADGDEELLPGLELLSTPGHVAGLMSVLVRLDSGAVLLCGDAIPSAAVLDERGWDAFEDPAAAERSADRLLARAEAEGARLLFGHDLDQWEEIPHAPTAF